MRKHYFFVVIVCSFWIPLFAQVSAPQVIASGGASVANSSFINTYTIGELALIETYATNEFILTQGFNQPFLRKETINSIFIPNGISPNGDGINDKWEIPYLKNYPTCTIKVFNRWGQQVFYNYGYTQFWDGTYNGNALPAADYYFVIALEQAAKKEYTGTITIKY